jgi:hypothetical protein
MSQRHSEAAFETVIETHLLANGYVTMNRDGFDRQRAIFPETVLAFIRATQPKEWVNLDTRRTATERTIVLLKEHRTAIIAAAVIGRITIRESTEDTLLRQSGSTMRC